MNIRSMFLAIAILGFTATSIAPAALAAPAGFAEGVRAYNARDYRGAVGYFSQAGKAAPADPAVHYYLGLSYQGMNQMTLAKQEYAYVAQCTNPTLRSQASAALANLGHYSTSYTGSSWGGATQKAPPPVSATKTGSATTAQVAPPSGTAKASGRLQILYFTADW